eukprot:255416_1
MGIGHKRILWITLFFVLYIGIGNGQSNTETCNTDDPASDEHFCEECETESNPFGCIVCQPAVLIIANCGKCSCTPVWWLWVILVISVICIIAICTATALMCCQDWCCCCCQKNEAK